jgi:hypothetical protein
MEGTQRFDSRLKEQPYLNGTHLSRSDRCMSEVHNSYFTAQILKRPILGVTRFSRSSSSVYEVLKIILDSCEN